MIPSLPVIYFVECLLRTDVLRRYSWSAPSIISSTLYPTLPRGDIMHVFIDRTKKLQAGRLHPDFEMRPIRTMSRSDVGAPQEADLHDMNDIYQLVQNANKPTIPYRSPDVDHHRIICNDSTCHPVRNDAVRSHSQIRQHKTSHFSSPDCTSCDQSFHVVNTTHSLHIHTPRTGSVFASTPTR